jgi:hypothetical protein
MAPLLAEHVAPQTVNGLLSPPLTPGKHNGRDLLTNSADSDHSDDSTGPSDGYPPPPEVPRVEREPLLNGVQNGESNLRQRRSRPSATTANTTSSLGIPTLSSHTRSRSRSRSRSRFRGQADSDAGSRAADGFPRISRPVELMRNSYDCVVIGSGYGGGIAASRMARSGLSVCLLERGREKWPGEYPTGTGDALSELHCSGAFAPYSLKGKMVDGSNPTGMYHLIFGKGQNAVVCNGKSSTSRDPHDTQTRFISWDIRLTKSQKVSVAQA